MTKVGRNQSCPCGSGKKYKQCCLATDEAAAVAACEEQRRTPPPTPVSIAVRRWGPVDDPYERLAEISNRTVDLIRDGQLEEAERHCLQLLSEFPDLPDGHMRLGQLFRVRGEPKRAAEHLRLAAAPAHGRRHRESQRRPARRRTLAARRDE